MSTFARPNPTWDESKVERQSGKFSTKLNSDAEPGVLTAFGDVRPTTSPMDPAFIESQVALRAGEREISDEVAANIAADLLSANGYLPQLNAVARGDEFDVEGLHIELGGLYPQSPTPRTRGRIDAMFTWALHGGDNN